MAVTVYFDSRGLEQSVTEACKPVLEKVGEIIQEEAIRSMAEGGGTPSPKGTPPNIQTGNLRDNIAVEVDKTGVKVGMSVEALYGNYHELGERPFLRPALYNKSKEILDAFREMDIANTPTGRRMNSRGRV